MKGVKREKKCRDLETRTARASRYAVLRSKRPKLDDFAPLSAYGVHLATF